MKLKTPPARLGLDKIRRNRHHADGEKSAFELFAQPRQPYDRLTAMIDQSPGASRPVVNCRD
jgi:hypothetical protein